MSEIDEIERKIKVLAGQHVRRIMQEISTTAALITETRGASGLTRLSREGEGLLTIRDALTLEITQSMERYLDRSRHDNKERSDMAGRDASENDQGLPRVGASKEEDAVTHNERSDRDTRITGRAFPISVRSRD